MPMKIKPVLLRTAAAVSGSIKDHSPAAIRRYSWNGLHRLISDGVSLRLMTTDGTAWLTWGMLAVEQGEAFDIILDSARFNSLIAKCSEGNLFTISRSENQIAFSQNPLVLRLREESPQEYPEPAAMVVNHTFEASAERVAASLNFVQAFVDTTNTAAPKKVLTWFPSGIITGGQLKRVAVIQGCPRTPHFISMLQKTARSVVSFLKALPGQVRIDLGDTAMILTCTTDRHQLRVGIEPVEYPALAINLSNQGEEIFRVDRASFLAAVEILIAVLPPSQERLNLRICGIGSAASIQLSTMGDRNRCSQDEVAIIRQAAVDGVPLDPQPEALPECWLGVMAKFLKTALVEAESVYLDVEVFSRRKLIRISEVVDTPEALKRQLLLSVVLTTPEEAAIEPVEAPPSPTPTPAAAIPAEEEPSPAEPEEVESDSLENM